MSNYFSSPFVGGLIKDQITNPNIIAGEYSIYSGYYHGHSFDNCARYLSPDRTDVDKLIIGKFCSIGSGASFIMAGNQGHRSDWISTFPFFYDTTPEFSDGVDGFQTKGDTIIGNDVWIGTEAMIMPGLQIGDGAIIGSRALVTKDVLPYTVVGGNPAKSLKRRFSEGDCELLMEMAWWNWEMKDIQVCVPALCSSDIQALYSYFLSQIKPKQ